MLNVFKNRGFTLIEHIKYVNMFYMLIEHMKT